MRRASVPPVILGNLSPMQTPQFDSPLNSDKERVGQSSRRRKQILAASAAFCLAIWACCWLQPDWLAPVTLTPAWCWLALGLALTAWGMSRNHRLWSLAVLTLWAAYAAVLVEEARSLLRWGAWPTAQWRAARARGQGVRVVSLNCAVGNWQAAAETATWAPDIVLLQESPSDEHLGRLARELFGADGAFCWGGDASILARGRIHPRRVDARSHYVHAAVELPSGLEAEVISLRLHPPVSRVDFWTPAFWIDHRNNRIRHRRQILNVMQQIRSIPPSAPLIVGGDFNSPPSDAALAPLRQQLFDTFRTAGRGWGNTGANSLPWFRVDQIWASQHFLARSVTAKKTMHSDHRMVVCDLIGKP